MSTQDSHLNSTMSCYPLSILSMILETFSMEDFTENPTLRPFDSKLNDLTIDTTTLSLFRLASILPLHLEFCYLKLPLSWRTFIYLDYYPSHLWTKVSIKLFVNKNMFLKRTVIFPPTITTNIRWCNIYNSIVRESLES